MVDIENSGVIHHASDDSAKKNNNGEDAKAAVLITGVSTGIGFSAAATFIGAGYFVYGSVRTEQDAKQLSKKFPTNFQPLVFDVTDQRAIEQAAAFVSSQLEKTPLLGIINNAGIAVPGPLLSLDTDALKYQFDVNAFGLHRVTQIFLPLLLSSRVTNQRIINISSISGRLTYPFMGAYAASKHAVEAMSDAMRRELMIHDIDVIVVQPGSVNTPIWQKADGASVTSFSKTPYVEALGKTKEIMVAKGEAGIAVDKIGAVILKAFTDAKPKTRYLVPRNYLSSWLIPRLMPDRVFDRVIASKLGIKAVRSE